MTRIELERRLREGGIPDAAWEARLLFCHVTGISAAEALAFPEREGDENALTALAARRIAREPLQYILGETGFYNEIYTVRPGVLIPRSDTECLVEEALRTAPKRDIRFLDLCTGVLEGDQVTVYAPDEITMNRMDNDRVRNALKEEAEKATGMTLRVVLRAGEAPQATPQENLKNLLNY